MNNHCEWTSPEAESMRRQRIVEFWSAVHIDEDSGSTTWEVLEGLERRVTDCLAAQPPNIDLAEQLTAKTLLIMATGQEDL